MNLLLRVVSAAVLLPLVLALIHLGGWFFYGLILTAAAICFFEYGGIVSRDDPMARGALVITGSLLVALGMLAESAALAFALTHAAALVLAILFTLRTGELDTAWRRLSLLAFGLPYVGLALLALHRLRALGEPLESEWARPTWLYVALIATWSNDTFAYFAGRAFGKHKLYEKVSPKKTWEGFFGGLLGTVGMLFAFRYAFPNAFAHFTSLDVLFIGVPAAALGPVGDLAESLLKRNFGVKDSGHTIPGHGGMLDRVDALFFVGPWVLAYAVGIRPLLV